MIICFFQRHDSLFSFLTGKIGISEYYDNNLKPFFDYIDKDILWIGPADKQILRSKKAIIDAWSKEKPVLTFTMGNIVTYPVPLTSKCCNIILNFPIYTHYPDGTTHIHNQRMDFTWIERKISDSEGNGVTVPRLIKIHISNAFRLSDDDFIYAVHSKDVNTGQIILSPHTSYLVNPLHISSVQRFSITLDNGKYLPIPEKKYTKFKMDFTDWIDRYNQKKGIIAK